MMRSNHTEAAMWPRLQVLGAYVMRWVAAVMAVWATQVLDFAPRLTQLQRMETSPNEIVLMRMVLAAAASLAGGWAVERRGPLPQHWAFLFLFGLFCLLAKVVDLLTG